MTDAASSTHSSVSLADERAMDRVEGVLLRVAQRGAPLRAGGGPRPERALEGARRRAERRADEAGRDMLLAEAREMVVEAYVSRLGDMRWGWNAGFASPYGARDRADSRAALLDLVTAAVTEDLLEPSDVRLLRDDGEWLLGHPVPILDVSWGSGTPTAASDPMPPRENAAAQRVIPVIGAAALVAIVFLIVAGATEDVVIGALVATVVVVLLVLSVVGPSWWEHRGRTP